MTNSTAPSSPRLSISAGTALPSFSRPMTTRWASGRSTRAFASASSRMVSPLSGTSALAVVMSRPGTRATPGSGRKRFSSTPMCTTVICSLGTPICARRCRVGRLRDGDDARDARCDAQLHPQEPVPAAQREPAAEAGRVRDVELAVDGDRVVDRRGDRPAVLHHPEHARAEALVVVDEVEVVATVPQDASGALAERPRLGEAGHAHDAELTHVDGVAGTHARAAPGTGRAGGRGRARHLDELGGVVELRPRLA